ncbi:MAG: LysE family transporter [Spirochaetes bacterium]|nr:LysE family transporter [Spirochaetota bacterium]
MNPLVLPFLSYAVVTTFTPGPNNITASAIGMRIGYRRALPCLAGMALGFFSLMFASGLLTDFLINTYTTIAPWVKWVGVAYMGWLAISLFLPHEERRGKEGGEATFLAGLLLQLANPKVILYGITIYTSFSILIAGSFPVVVLSAVCLTLLGFSSVSLWAVAGSSLGRAMRNKGARIAFNIVMAALLAWCAWSIATH